MKIQLHKAVDAYLASPSIAPMLPPPVGIPRKRGAVRATQHAENDGHPLAHLMRLRDEAAAEIERSQTAIERLLAFLDATDGAEDCEPSLGYPEPNISPPADGYGYQGTTRTDEGDQSDQRGFGCTDDRESSLPVPIEFLDRFNDLSNADDLEEAVDDVACDDNELDDPREDGGETIGDDDEDGNDSEPSLGAIESHFSIMVPDGRSSMGHQACWAGSGTDDCEDEHDGREDGLDREGDRSDFEPSLGWPEQGAGRVWDGAEPDFADEMA